MKKTFWKNKKILITGHTGFKGSWLTLILNNLGAKVVGYALHPISKPNFFDGCGLNKFIFKDYRSDIRDLKNELLSYKLVELTENTNKEGTHIRETSANCLPKISK